MIQLFTDFASNDLYVGQVKAAILRVYPGAAVIDLLHDAKAYAVQPAAHLLAALLECNPAFVTMAVVDPGVGGARRALAVETEAGWLVGPDNGLLSVVVSRASHRRLFEIVWRPDKLSSTFHGRDLFAPVAAMIASNTLPHGALQPVDAMAVDYGGGPLAQVIHVDHYGSLMTGLPAAVVSAEHCIKAAGRRLRFAHCFSDVPPGALFWYENSLGLVELAMNQGDAANTLSLTVGDPISLGAENA